MTRIPYDMSTKEGNSTCGTRCDNGWTTDGDKRLHECVTCNPRCESCEDQGVVGDVDRCQECSPAYPFKYAKEKTCFTQCGTFPEVPVPGQPAKGLYKINSKTCGECDDVCLDCEGDKFNCTRCDKAIEKALFQKKMMIGGTL